MVKLIQILLSLLFRSQPKVEDLNKSEPNKETALIKTEEVKLPTTKPVRHTNNGKCEKCEQIFNKYPGFHQGMKEWFIQIQASHPEAHISAAGRGKAEQEEYFKKGTSKAHYGQSSHNKNAALDIFKLHANGAEWPKAWFQTVIKPAIDANNAAATFKIKWYGEPGSSFYELPHCELDGWKTNSDLKLVEPV